MKGHRLELAIVAVVMFAVTPLTLGEVFNNPPEDNAAITWSNQFPYQRNIMLKFDADPVGPVGKIPGADYEGYHDPLLWDSDFIEISGDVEWNEAKGALGIFDAEGNESGEVIFHFDNWERPWPVKHFYEEMVLQVEQVTGQFYQDVVLPEGCQVTDDWDSTSEIGQGRYEILYWLEFQPNPPWEEKVYTFSTTAGGSIYLDSLHIATECIPEPATLSLLVMGALVTVGRRRKR